MDDPEISQEEALAMLKVTAEEHCAAVREYITAQINQNQFDALCSFTYNLGAGNLAELAEIVNLDPNDPRIREEFGKYVYAYGEIMQGLVKRRAEEANLYLS
jgi:lysozyme